MGDLPLDRLLSRQKATSGPHDETLLVIVHQTSKLRLEQIIHELKLA